MHRQFKQPLEQSFFSDYIQAFRAREDMIKEFGPIREYIDVNSPGIAAMHVDDYIESGTCGGQKLAYLHQLDELPRRARLWFCESMIQRTTDDVRAQCGGRTRNAYVCLVCSHIVCENCVAEELHTGVYTHSTGGSHTRAQVLKLDAIVLSAGRRRLSGKYMPPQTTTDERAKQKRSRCA